MAFSVGGAKGRPSGDINITPLIDIVLVLLIIFMVMTPVMLKELVAKVPQKNTKLVPPPPGDNPIVVEVDGRDQLSLNGEALAPESLAAAVTERLRHDRQKVVFFKIDDEASYGSAVRVMDVCKGAGAATLGIITKDDKNADK